MPNAEFEKLKEALRKAPTEEARKEAAQAFERYRVVQLAGQKQSRPTLVSLGFRKDYPRSVPLDKIPEELERNPAFYEHLRDIVEAD